MLIIKMKFQPLLIILLTFTNISEKPNCLSSFNPGNYKWLVFHFRERSHITSRFFRGIYDTHHVLSHCVTGNYKDFDKDITNRMDAHHLKSVTQYVNAPLVSSKKLWF